MVHKLSLNVENFVDLIEEGETIVIRNCKVPIVNGSVPHSQYGKYSGAKVLLKPASNGTGVIAGGAMRAVLESVGIKDVLAKSQGSSNPHNVVKATLDALTQLRDARTVAQQRGIKMSRVFNG